LFDDAGNGACISFEQHIPNTDQDQEADDSGENANNERPTPAICWRWQHGITNSKNNV
jgi:hypothetical protein